MFAGLSDPAGYRFLADDPPVTEAALRDRYRRQVAGPPGGGQRWLNWIVRRRRGDAPLGFTQATIDGRDALIGYQLFPACWGRGVGTESVRLTLRTLFGRPEVGRVLALVDTRNDASIALLRRLGFRLLRTIADADRFKGTSSDEHEFALERSATGIDRTVPRRIPPAAVELPERRTSLPLHPTEADSPTG